MPYLMVDTSLFDREFQDRLLMTLPDIDGQMDGLLVNSENYQGLRLAEECYKSGVQCVYIDPPYNTGGDGFLYKDSYQHSSWGSFLVDRVAAGEVFLDSNRGSWFSSIDDGEQAFLRNLMSLAFGAENFVANIIWQKKYAPANDAKWLSDDHDFILCYARNKELWKPGRIGRDEKQDKAYSNPDKDPRGDWKAGDYKCNKSADERPNLYYPITNPNTGKEVWPQRNRVWAYSITQHAKNVAENRVWWGKDGTNEVPAYKRFLSGVGDLVPRTIWKHDEVGHNQDGIRQLRAILPDTLFTSPKPCGLIERVVTVGDAEVVLDFFAGSGTTGHAVINLNRQDGGNRRYILMEAGRHFDDVLKKRLQKVVLSQEWKDGLPVAQKKPVNPASPCDGVSHAFKVLRLESYEDALANIEFTHESEGELFAKTVGEEYLLKYALEFETQGSATRLRPEAFVSPFDYQLQLFDGMETKAKPVDLPETFNYLIGLKVMTRRWLERKTGKTAHRYLHITGTANGDGKRVAVLWRTVPAAWKEADYQAEKEWARQAKVFEGADRGWFNGPGTFLGAQPLDAEFRRLLFA